MNEETISPKPIKNYEGLYSITTDGRVWSHYNTPNGRWLKHYLDKDGYPIVGLFKDKKQKHKKIHRLVAHAYIPNPLNKPEINHKNGVKIDNRYENLEWVTHKENSDHAWKTGLFDNRNIRGENGGGSKLTWEEVNEIRNNHVSKGISKRKPWLNYQISQIQYYNIIRNVNWIVEN